MWLYRRKRQPVQRAGVHLIEIDLIRRGQRPQPHPTLPLSPYLVTLLRGHAAHFEAWPGQLDQPLPTIPMPLLPPDADVVLPLQTALTAMRLMASASPTARYPFCSRSTPKAQIRRQSETARSVLLLPPFWG
ncbi:MAG TPA: hypothetical protein DCL15_13590 [Chloroflexi bacterium]|nr:hypothetical protein [Chloroflexota bacterium]